MSLGQRITSTWRRDGLPGLLLGTAIFLLRRVGWRASAWSTRLDYRLAKRSICRKLGPELKRNEVFRNRHEGRRCFVIGNGPSLSTQDLSLLADEITFAVNYFHLHPIVGKSWQPTYYCLSDPVYFEDQSIANLKDIVSTIPSAPFFVPHYASDFLKRTGALPPDRTYYVGLYGGLEDEWTEKPDFTSITPGLQTVVQLSIMAAMYMGCSTIYLMGLDHDWLSHGGVAVNFYRQEEVKNEGATTQWNYKALMVAMTTIWQVYEMHERIARAYGIKIINVTRGGFLDVFERDNYEDVVAEKMAVRAG